MLTAEKHLDLDTSLVRVAAVILKELKRKGAVAFEALRKLITRRVGEDGELMFLPALRFLFLLGRVEYHTKNDVVELVGVNNAD
ncbi:MAG: hypothetical protein GYB24_14495 [Rhodobacteraceae bacterium]|nr:hypothetical protein [Paracoccaceae bacterium]